MAEGIQGPRNLSVLGWRWEGHLHMKGLVSGVEANGLIPLNEDNPLADSALCHSSLPTEPRSSK